MATTADSIRAIINPLPSNQVQEEVKRYLNTEFNDLDSLLSPSAGGGGAGPSRKKRKTLDQEIEYYEKLESDAAKELEVTKVELPKLLDITQTEIQALLTSTQGLSSRRFGLVDRLSRLIVDLNSEEGEEGTILDRLEGLQDELSRLEVSHGWIEVVERVVLLSEEVLDKRNHSPSPLSVLGRYRDLCEIVSNLKRDLPAGMTLLELVDGVREKTWAGLKEVMSKNLIQAAESLKWPLKIIYPNIPASQRRAFERGYQDLLYLQAEGERLHLRNHGDWTKGDGLYPLQALVKGIELRFKYHFQGSRNTNRVDKPEWAFANILDQIYEHQSFIKEYLQPLTTKAGYDINVKSEFTLLLFPILLQFLKSRIPHLLDHPALLAHTIYQTILFDESVKSGGFELGETSLATGSSGLEWEGLSGVILKQEGWFGQWVDGERKFGENQINEIISSADAWNISEDLEEESLGGLKATVSSRQIKALIEQITDRYSPLPQIIHKLPFLTTIQLPLLSTYHARITSSLDAFETLSSAFVRSVPGALTQMRGGIHVDQRSLTGGVEGLGRLIKAHLSTGWVLGSMREWADDPFFIEMSDQLINTPSVKYKLQADPYLSNPNPSGEDSWSVWDLMIETYMILGLRGEEMIVRLITAEVEGDLKKHLQRRWDQQITPSPDDPTNTHPSLISALVTLSTSLSHLSSHIPQTPLLRIYRYLVENLVTHISHRGVYSGWSKFTSIGGHSFSLEIQEFIHTSQSALDQIPREVVARPWAGLVHIGKVLELPNEGEITFQEGMAAAWGGEGAVKEFGERLGVEFGVGELQALMRRRVECWR